MVEHSNRWQLTALQLCSSPDPTENLIQIRSLLSQLPPQRPQLVALPEGALCFDGAPEANQQLAEPLGLGFWQAQLAELAREFKIYLLCGTFPTLPATAPVPVSSMSQNDGRFCASSLLYSPQGHLLADYQKLHLFDALVGDSTQSYRESARTVPGEKLTLADLGSLKLGMAVCYDLRFPGLFQCYRQQGANVLALPSAFTTVTGAAHWHALLRARAIENQCFVIAPAQTGRHGQGRETYGHSLIIDPWGKILAEAAQSPVLISVSIELSEISELEARMPMTQHNRFRSELL